MLERALHGDFLAQVVNVRAIDLHGPLVRQHGMILAMMRHREAVHDVMHGRSAHRAIEQRTAHVEKAVDITDMPALCEPRLDALGRLCLVERRKRLHDEVAVAQVKRILRGERLVHPAADVREAAIHLALAIELAHIKIIADAQRDDGVAPARVLAHEAFEHAAVEQPRAVLEELLGVLLAKIIPQTNEQAGIARRIKDGLLRHEAERQQQDPRADDERKRAVAPERRILPLPVKHQEHCLNRNEGQDYPVVTFRQPVH